MSRPSETNINAKRFKSISSPININGDIFTSTSESIAKFMIEKLISLAVTQSHHQMIINQIPDYCFDKLKQTLQIYTEIQFLSYDRDDLDPVHHLSFPHPKSAVDVDEKISLDNNQSKQYLNVSDNNTKVNHDKILKKYFNDKSESIENNLLGEENKAEKIDIIPKVETHMLNIPKNELRHMETIDFMPQKIFYDAVYEGTNDWDVLPMPSPVEIDRDACSMIRTTKVEEKKDENNNKETETKENEKKTTQTYYTSSHRERKNYSGGYGVVKKKPRVPVELPSYDIPQERLGIVAETEEFHILREEAEKESKIKEKERKKRLKIEKENMEKMKEKQIKQKDIEKKNITVDIKGNIIQIKPIVLEDLAREFTNADSKTQEIDRIEAPDPQKTRKGPIKVEKNPNLDNSRIIVKSIKDVQVVQNVKDLLNKSKGGKSLHPVQQAQPFTQLRDKLESPTKRDKKPIIPGGSSFDKIKLECGVTFHEESKMKTGGKDFFKKYNRYSLENYERQLGITSYNITKKQKEIKEETKIEPIEEKQNTGNFYTSNFANTEPSAMNSTLHLKTKNLKNAISNLDLITEAEENEMQKQFNKTRPDKLFIRTHKETQIEEKFDDMDQFAKTLMSPSDWAKQPYKNRNMRGYAKVPFKPRDTNEGFNTRHPHSKINMRTKTVSTGIRAYATTMNGFFKKKKNLSPIGKETKEFIRVLEKDDKDDFARTTTDKMFRKKK